MKNKQVFTALIAAIAGTMLGWLLFSDKGKDLQQKGKGRLRKFFGQ